jgi:hypothetical protein
MEVGMLWYDDDAKRQLSDKVARAVEFYRNKYGVQPTECYVHPGMLSNGEPTMAAGVRLRPHRTVNKNHFWLGVGKGSAGSDARGRRARPARA